MHSIKFHSGLEKNYEFVIMTTFLPEIFQEGLGNL